MTAINEPIEAIVRDVVARDAVSVDRDGAFPRAAVDTLGSAGLLGLVSAQVVGGRGRGPRAAATVVERLARECGSTAMVVTMHYSGVAVLEKYASEDVRRAAASGRHLSTLAFSETGSRSQFWAPVGTAKVEGDNVVLNGKKSFATSASQATAYVWSSRPASADGASTLWLVPTTTPGVRVQGRFDGLGLRGNDSAPVVAEDARLPLGARLGPDGGGLDIMLSTVLPLFNLLSAAFCLGLCETATQRTATHAAGTRFEHAGSTIADLPTVRAYIARMRIKTDALRALLDDTSAALEQGRADATLRVLECKALAGETATEVSDLALRVCGGAAYRRDVGVERVFRDARASTVMAPTTDTLYELIGRAVCGMPAFG
jgi:alkylation response protein AidB-like acyl-CoA dehydrogenase